MLCPPFCTRCKTDPKEHNCHIPTKIDSDELQDARYYTIDARIAAKVELVWGKHVTAKEALGMKLCLHATRLLEKVALPEELEARLERDERAGERSAAREGAHAAAIVPLVTAGASAPPPADYRCPTGAHAPGNGPTVGTILKKKREKFKLVGERWVCPQCERSERRRQSRPATPAAALPTAAPNSPDQENAVQAVQAAEPAPTRAGDEWSPSPRSRAAGPGLRPLPNGEAGAVSSGQATGERDPLAVIDSLSDSLACFARRQAQDDGGPPRRGGGGACG